MSLRSISHRQKPKKIDPFWGSIAFGIDHTVGTV